MEKDLNDSIVSNKHLRFFFKDKMLDFSRLKLVEILFFLHN